MSDYLTDLTGIVSLGATAATKQAKHTVNERAGKDLEMQDFLQLMVATLQNQTIDNTADISDMMNQMVQMSVIEALTNINNLVSQTSGLNYAASLVGKEVTIGQYVGRELNQFQVVVTGTGTLDGKQVIFAGDESYWLSDVLAVGRLPQNSGNLTAPTVNSPAEVSERTSAAVTQAQTADTQQETGQKDEQADNEFAEPSVG